MDILTTAMCGASITRTQESVVWVYQGPEKTGLRWCYLFLTEIDALICCMTGNPMDDNFRILENFRPATNTELQGLDYMEIMMNRDKEKN